jgi:hypothetical protein
LESIGRSRCSHAGPRRLGRGLMGRGYTNC